MTSVDVALVGGGIMSATLGAFLKLLEPTWQIALYERLDAVAQESSNPWNNAGTGHAALCELNYTAEKPDGTVDIAKAITINEQFELSYQFWQHLADQGHIPSLDTFMSNTPHMTFVRGEKNVDFLRRRWEALTAHPRFASMEYSTDPAKIAEWAPLLVKDRDPDEPIAATFAAEGTDVDFGALTRHLVAFIEGQGADVEPLHEVKNISRRDGGWRLTLKDKTWNAHTRTHTVDAKFVFVGAGGGALHLLQQSGIPEAVGYGGFPISGEFLRTSNPAVVAEHQAKVYGKADVGAPPMSVPHLDTRVVDGTSYLLFGPYAGFSPKFLKKGSWLDLPESIRPGNLVPMLAVAKDNFDLLQYLVGQLTASSDKKFEQLLAFMPTAKPSDWETITAGQRVQVMKKHPEKHGVLEFGTEVVAAADGTIAGLLGASPGASTAAPIMVKLLRQCFPADAPRWEGPLAAMIPALAGDAAGAEHAEPAVGEEPVSAEA
ncbi:malate dehydrogenase (quinone) [Luteimicrobium subarcticum]|uniref:Probable malate:quinone oxidoreductase n=1 Tax=Luteimicrobium subarcticum TaxID=620910 RepID=A0A2M8WQX3_9MICO|nr:malate dehydrogenase (quinone) [Luteimicrobium subarcticum]PJI93328.1 malate dehydrogenase (quinone) [Luteimicrobium subarcticum]